MTEVQTRSLTVGEMLDAWAELDRQVGPMLEAKQRLQFAIQQAMEKEAIREVPHDKVLCILELGKPTPDISKLHTLAEMVPAEEWNLGYVSAHEETIQVPERFDLRRVKTWTKYGRLAQEVLDSAIVRGPAYLRISRKEKA